MHLLAALALRDSAQYCKVYGRPGSGGDVEVSTQLGVKLRRCDVAVGGMLVQRDRSAWRRGDGGGSVKVHASRNYRSDEPGDAPLGGLRSSVA